MSNASIIQSMKEACDQWDAGNIDSQHLTMQLGGLFTALDGVKRSEEKQAAEWLLKIDVASDYGNFEGHTQAIVEIKKVLTQIRVWIDTLPT
jgi:hypothetical protein